MNRDDVIPVIQEKNIKTVKNVFENFNKHDWKDLADLYKEPAEFKDPSYGMERVKQSRNKI